MNKCGLLREVPSEPWQDEIETIEAEIDRLMLIIETIPFHVLMEAEKRIENDRKIREQL